MSFPLRTALRSNALVSLFLNALFLLLTIPIHAQIITTVAGNGMYAYSGDGGMATAAGIPFPIDVVVDKKGNLFIVDQDRWNIRKVAPDGIITTLIGGNFTGPLFYPSAIAIDSISQLFIADTEHHRVCKVDTNGVLITVAGNGTEGFSGDGGLATAASLNSLRGVVVDRLGNLFIFDTENDRIRKVDTNGIIMTVAGNGTLGFSGDGGPATAAALYRPRGLAIDKQGNILIADAGNNRIRQIDKNGIITTVAGSSSGNLGDGGLATNARLNLPCDVVVDSTGNLFIADAQHNIIRMVAPNGIISTVAGNGQKGFSGDGGYSEKAAFDASIGVTVDSRGNLFIADLWNHRVRKVSGLLISKQTGSWADNSIWNCQCTPAINSSVTISPGHNVTVGEPVQARALKQYGRLVLTPNSKITFPSRGF